jgi:hypothetical protein
MDFSVAFADKESQKSSSDFGSINVGKRVLTDKTSDTMTGKLAEYAFMKFCRQNGLDINIDFEITNGKLNIDDGQDISEVNGKPNIIKSDIKGSKNYSQWLMVESHKISKHLICADLYILVKLNLPSGVEKDLSLCKKECIETEFAGFALKTDFFDIKSEPWFKYLYDSSPLKTSFVEQIVNHAKSSLKQGETLSKLQFRNAYRALKYNFTKEKMYMGMKQKANENFGLPVKYLRSSDDQVDMLFTALKTQSFSNIAKTSIWY